MKAFAFVLLLVLLCGTFCNAFGTNWKKVEKHLNHARLMSLLKGDEKVSRFSDVKCPILPTPVDFDVLFPSGTIAGTAVETAMKKVQEMLDPSNNPASGVTGLTLAGSYAGKTFFSAGMGTVELYRDQGHKITPSASDTVFRIGSVTKLFTAAMVYQLAERGSLASLDDPISKYSAFKMLDPWDDPRGATFRQVLSQLGGLPRESPCDISATEGWSCNETTATMLSRLEEVSYILPRNSLPSYSNLGFALAGNVAAESVASPSTTFSSYVRNNILQPLYMDNTSMEYNPASDTAVGYTAPNVPAGLYSSAWQAPAGDIFSTATDMLTFLDIFGNNFQPRFGNTPNVTLTSRCRDGPVLSRNSAREMLAPVFVNNDRTTMFGSPWEIFDVQQYVVRTKGGNVPGFSALALVVPDLRLSMVALFNGGVDEFSMVEPLMQTLVPAFQSELASKQPDLPLLPPTSVLSRLNGTYVSQIGTVATVYTTTVSAKTYLILLIGASHLPLTYSSSSDTTVSAQIWLPPGTMPCLTGETLALEYQFVTFTLPRDKPVSSLNVGGMWPGQVFQRQNGQQ